MWSVQKGIEIRAPLLVSSAGKGQAKQKAAEPDKTCSDKHDKNSAAEPRCFLPTHLNTRVRCSHGAVRRLGHARQFRRLTGAWFHHLPCALIVTDAAYN